MALILSNALDTNGQNARFVRAAERWGSDTGVLKALAIGNADPAGVVGRYQAAADKFGSLVIREAHKSSAYFDFPTDIVWNRKTEAMIRELAEQADVVHLNNSDVAARRLRVRKPLLLHHHGSLFRNHADHWLAVAKAGRMTQAVSTIDLAKPDPKLLHWLPTAYDVAELQAFGTEHRREPDGRVRIVHCPTNRKLKNTAVLEAAVKALQADGLPVDLVLVEGRKWADALAIKATADIVFDQLLYGYGCNAVEAWGMGIPVIAGAEDPWVLDRMRKEWGGLPFLDATEKNLVEILRLLVESANGRAEWAQRGLEHVRTYHDEKPALTRLAELYAMTIERATTATRIPGKGVQFRSTGRYRHITLDGQTAQFGKDGLAEVTDPYLVQHLRTLAKRKNFGIAEVRDVG